MPQPTYYSISDDQGRLIRCKCRSAMYGERFDEEDFLHLKCAKCERWNPFSAFGAHTLMKVHGDGRRAMQG